MKEDRIFSGILIGWMLLTVIVFLCGAGLKPRTNAHEIWCWALVGVVAIPAMTLMVGVFILAAMGTIAPEETSRLLRKGKF